MEEFSDFRGYMDYIESQGAHKAGLAKVIACILMLMWLKAKSSNEWEKGICKCYILIIYSIL